MVSLIIFLIPLILTPFFKDKLSGALIIITSNSLIHLLIALLTQYLKIFDYQTIIYFYSTVSILSILYYIKNRRKIKRGNGMVGNRSKDLVPDFYENEKIVDGDTAKYVHIKKTTLGISINSTANFLQKYAPIILAFFIVFINLYFVHYNFTGTVNSISGHYEVKNAFLPHPYFSDEWAAIAFVKYTIDNKSLPVVNPLNLNISFNDPLVVYFSFLSDVFLFFNLDPLHDYILLTLIVGMLVVLAFALLLHSLGVQKSVLAISILIIPYITNGGNLPGIWFLIPMIFALIFFFISIIAIVRRNNILYFLSSLLCLCLYPPFIAFVVPVILAYIVKNIRQKNTIKIILALIVISFVTVGIFVFNTNSISDAFDKFLNYILRTNLVGGFLHFPIWFVVPVFVLPFAFLGLVILIKRRLYSILFPIIIGLLYWLFYTYSQIVFLIDKPRVVVITSFLILISFALMIDYLFKRFINERSRKIILFASLFIAIIMSVNYTNNETWKNLTLHYNGYEKGHNLPPAATASVFLTDTDLKLFGEFTKKYFLAPPWKGLAIGAATGNYPYHSKPSTIGVFILNYDEFLNGSDCNRKTKIAKEHNLEYVYSEWFECKKFKEIGRGDEGLILYRFEK